MGEHPVEFTGTVGTARVVVQVKLSNRHPEREILVIDTPTGAVALFGYFYPADHWHFMIVPPEFREEVILGYVKGHLLSTHQATLRTIPGDTINLSAFEMRALPLYRPRPLQS